MNTSAIPIVAPTTALGEDPKATASRHVQMLSLEIERLIEAEAKYTARVKELSGKYKELNGSKEVEVKRVLREIEERYERSLYSCWPYKKCWKREKSGGIRFKGEQSGIYNEEGWAGDVAASCGIL
jgi:hypothetical protein